MFTIQVSFIKSLQKKFFIPTVAQYKDEVFFQSASELTVAHHIKKRQVSDFEIEKRVNGENRKDVDVFFRVKSTKVAIEVKCPFEEEPPPTLEYREQAEPRAQMQLMKRLGKHANPRLQVRNSSGARTETID